MCNNNLRIITELANKIKKIIADIFNLNTNMTELDNKIDTKVTEFDSRIDILEKKTIECKGSEAIDVDEGKKVSLKLGDNEEVLNIQQDGLHFNKELIDTERTNAINSKATEIVNKVDRDLLSYRTINDYNFTDSVLRANSITFNSTSNDIIKVPNSFRVKSTETIFESPFSYRINGIKMLSTSKDGGLYLKTKEDKDLFKINPEGKQLAYYGIMEDPILEIGENTITINDMPKVKVSSHDIELNPHQFVVRGYSQSSPDSDLVRTALFKVLSGDASDYPGQVFIKNLISDDKALFKNNTTFASDIIIADDEENPQLKIKNENGMICDISNGGYRELGTIKSLFNTKTTNTIPLQQSYLKFISMENDFSILYMLKSQWEFMQELMRTSEGGLQLLMMPIMVRWMYDNESSGRALYVSDGCNWDNSGDPGVTIREHFILDDYVESEHFFDIRAFSPALNKWYYPVSGEMEEWTIYRLRIDLYEYGYVYGEPWPEEKERGRVSLSKGNIDLFVLDDCIVSFAQLDNGGMPEASKHATQVL